MLAACPVHPKGIMVIPMLWRIHGYVVCVLGVKNQKHHTHPYRSNKEHNARSADITCARHRRHAMVSSASFAFPESAPEGARHRAR